MSSHSDATSATERAVPDAAPGSPEEIQAQIEVQREQLAGTLDALGAKLDVKAQARAKVADVREKATTPTGGPRPELVAAGLAVVVAVALVIWRRKR